MVIEKDYLRKFIFTNNSNNKSNKELRLEQTTVGDFDCTTVSFKLSEFSSIYGLFLCL